jgi:hypothetical protein
MQVSLSCRILVWRQGNLISVLFFLSSFSHGVSLSPLGTAVTVWPVVPAPDDT